MNGVLPAGSGRDTIVVTGAINDAGSDQEGQGGLETFRGSAGTFKIDTANAAPAFKLNLTTCSVSGTKRGTVTFSRGTGAYAGISGTVHVVFTTYAHVEKGPKGCSQNRNAVTGFIQIKGTGQVSFG